MPSPVAVAATTWQLTVTWSPERDLIRRRSTSNAPCGASWLENFNALVCVRVPSRSVRVGLAVGLQSACLAWCRRRPSRLPAPAAAVAFRFLGCHRCTSTARLGVQARAPERLPAGIVPRGTGPVFKVAAAANRPALRQPAAFYGREPQNAMIS